jgi:hypothetical protein
MLVPSRSDSIYLPDDKFQRVQLNVSLAIYTHSRIKQKSKPGETL